jgi:hypothetical protein
LNSVFSHGTPDKGRFIPILSFIKGRTARPFLAPDEYLLATPELCGLLDPADGILSVLKPSRAWSFSGEPPSGYHGYTHAEAPPTLRMLTRFSPVLVSTPLPATIHVT